MKITRREKILLYILLCVILFAVSIFLILMPALKKNTGLKADEEMARTNLSQLQNSELLSDKDFVSESAKYTEEIELAKQKFFVGFASEDVDKLITELVLVNKLKPISMAISKADEEVVNYSEYMANKAKSEDKETMDAASDGTDDVPTGNKMSTVFTATFEVEGDFINCENLLDNINNQKTMKVTKVDYKKDETGKQRISLVVKVYTIQ